MENGCIDDNKGKVSVIVPVYNVEKYLEQCLNSIINQTYKNIEIIIVNDGSTDNSLDIIERFRNKNKNKSIKVISQENKGISEARNTGLKNAVGEFILFVDSDDYLELNCIARSVETIINDRSEIVIFNYTKVFNGGIVGNNYSLGIIQETNEVKPGTFFCELMLKNILQGYAWNKLFKRIRLLEDEFSFESGRLVEDYYPIFKVLSTSKRISYLEESLYNYRQRDNSLVNTINKRIIDDYVYAITLIVKLADKMKFNKYIIEEFKLIKSYDLLKSYHKYCRNYNIKNIYKKFNEFKYNSIIPKIIKLKINKYNFKTIIVIVLWKFGLGHIIFNKWD